jgi:hypothetical protein
MSATDSEQARNSGRLPVGISGRVPSEWVADLRRNQRPAWVGIRNLGRLRRALSRSGCSMPYVAVLERQQRGALHPHLAVKGFQDVRLLRRCWYKIVGNGQGQVNVRGPRPGSSPVKLARYLSKVHQQGF